LSPKYPAIQLEAGSLSNGSFQLLSTKSLETIAPNTGAEFYIIDKHGVTASNLMPENLIVQAKMVTVDELLNENVAKPLNKRMAEKMDEFASSKIESSQQSEKVDETIKEDDPIEF